MTGAGQEQETRDSGDHLQYGCQRLFHEGKHVNTGSIEVNRVNLPVYNSQTSLCRDALHDDASRSWLALLEAAFLVRPIPNQ